MSGDVPKNRYTYKDAGVDIDAGNALVEAIKPFAKATERSGSMGGLGGFGALFDLKAAGYVDPVLVAATDGVGTKLRVAIETGQPDTVGIDLVAMCVNDLIVQGAEPLFFLDYFATGALDVELATRVIQGVAAGCTLANCALVGGESAEMPGMYEGSDYDLAGFAVGAVDRDAVLTGDNIEEGDVVLGLASSGVHSNGFSLIRRLIDANTIDLKATAPFADNVQLSDVLLTPTRIYVASVLPLLKDGLIKGLSHVTGGGLTENLPRLFNTDTHQFQIDLDSIAMPAVFDWIRTVSGLDQSEMLRTFNCGIGMAVVVDRESVQEVSTRLSDSGEEVALIGWINAKSAEAEAIIYSGSL